MPNPLLNQSASARQAFFHKNRQLLTQLTREGQQPQALFITCADSRITPTDLLEAKPGDLFMLRNIANIIPPHGQSESGTASLLEYAIQALKIPHIIICGHTDCGGILSLDKQPDTSQQPALSRWLSFAQPAQHEVDSQIHDLTPAARHQAIVERNVVLQLNHLQSYPYLRQAMADGQLALHGWVYDLHRQHIHAYDPIADTFLIV